MTRSRDLKRRGPTGMARTLSGDRRSDRNSSLQSTSRLAARSIAPLVVADATKTIDQRVTQLETVVNQILKGMKAAGLMEEV